MSTCECECPFCHLKGMDITETDVVLVWETGKQGNLVATRWDGDCPHNDIVRRSLKTLIMLARNTNGLKVNHVYTVYNSRRPHMGFDFTVDFYHQYYAFFEGGNKKHRFEKYKVCFHSYPAEEEQNEVTESTKYHEGATNDAQLDLQNQEF